MSEKGRGGYTFIELLLYIAIISVFITGAIYFSWDIILARVKVRTINELNQNLRLAAGRINYEVRNARGLIFAGTDRICLSSFDVGRNPTLIYKDGSQLKIAWGGGSADCTGALFSESLSSDSVDVTHFRLTDLSSLPQSINISYELTFEIGGQKRVWQRSQSISSSAELRSN